MKQNMGGLDRGIRIVAAIVIVVLYFTNQISGTLAIILGVVALAFVVSSFTGVCPLYFPFKISTKKSAS